MANFQRTKTIGAYPEHQEGHVAQNWTTIDESPEFWTAEKEVKRPTLKEGEDSRQEVLFSKQEWKLLAK